MTPEALAPLLYAAHCESRGWQDENGSLRPWSGIKDIERTHWSMVARKAITLVRVQNQPANLKAFL